MFALTSGILLFSHVLHQLRVHGVQRHEERLHGGVVGDGPPALGVALHTVDEDLDAALQGIQELLLVSVHLTILDTITPSRN